ncbi:hypothetical protein D3C79_669320 [compost metagenome]
MVQRRQPFADAIGLIQGQQCTGVGDRRGIEQQRLAVESHFAQGQVEALFDQGFKQARIAKQVGHRTVGRLLAAQRHQRRVGQQYMAGAVQGQYRIAHGREQGIELQVTTLAGEDVDHLYGLHAMHVEQRVVQLFEHVGAEGRGVDVDVRRHHLHGVQVEVAGAEQGQHFLGDADAVDETDVDAHGGGVQGCRRRPVCCSAQSRGKPAPTWVGAGLPRDEAGRATRSARD